MGEVTLLGFRQPGQLDTIGGTGGQVLGLNGELQHRTDQLMSLTHPRRAQPVAFVAPRDTRSLLCAALAGGLRLHRCA
jgi:hypothetical protein